MTACIVLLALGLIAWVFYVREKLRAYTLRAVFLKTLVSVFFLAVAVCGWYAVGRAEPLCLFTVLGLLLGLLGDVWLDLKYVYREQDAPFTYAGFGSFGAGHVLFCVGLILQFSRQGAALYAIVPILLGVACGFGTVALEKPMKLRYGKMKPVAIVYGALLFSTVLLSGSLALLHGWREPALNLFFAGAVSFAVSDLVLSGTYFGEGHERPADIILNYVFYYGGQFAIAFSLCLLR